MTLILAYKGRGLTRNLTIQDGNGTTITPGTNDEVRVTVGREGEAAVLTVASNAPASGGSTLTKGEANVLRLDASDLDFDPGTYTLRFDYFDNADGQEWKMVSKEPFHLEVA